MTLRVTEALALAGLVDPQWFTPESAARGTAVHAACALDDQGDLDEASVHEDVAPYLAAWRRFKAEAKPEILSIEEAVEGQGYRGTLDRRLMIAGHETVGDIKSGAPHPVHHVQVAGYAATFSRPLARIGIYLRGDGTYQLVPFRDRTDFVVWRAVLTVAQWRKEHQS